MVQKGEAPDLSGVTAPAILIRSRPSHSYREIARQLGVDVHTPHADVEAPRGEGHRACRLYGCRISGELRALGATVQRRRILPRSLHLPLAPTDGSLTENINK